MSTESNVHKEVIISITGGIHSSKTNIAALITEMLKDIGVTEIHVASADNDIGQRIRDLKEHSKRELILDAVKGCKVNVIDVNGNVE